VKLSRKKAAFAGRVKTRTKGGTGGSTRLGLEAAIASWDA
jgi:hypothetical protein